MDHLPLLLLVLVHTVLVGWGAYRHSPCVDEVGHLAAGLDHWSNGRFDLYRVNPPLVRLVATSPLALMGVGPAGGEWTVDPYRRPEFDLGQEFIRLHGGQSFRYFTIARWACLPFSLLGMLVCYRWSSELFGRRAGQLSAAVWCFCPLIVSNAQLITPDVGAAALGLLAAYQFSGWRSNPTWGSALALGGCLGLAAVTKYTLLALLILWPALWLSTVWRRGPGGRSRRCEFAMLCVAYAVVVIVINAVYLFEGSGTRLRDQPFISGWWTTARRGAPPSNDFQEHWLGWVRMPLPDNYLRGIDIQTHGFETGSWSYMRGVNRDHGWWYYYGYGLAVKWPLGTWFLVLLSASLFLWYRPLRSTPSQLVFLASSATALFVLVSSQTGFSRHLRYALPALPFVYVLVGRSVGSAPVPTPVWWRGLAVASVLQSCLSSLLVYPHSLSYFNEAAGGPEKGGYHLIDSNIDWGQDFLELYEWVQAHPTARPFYLAYYGGFDPLDVGLHYTPPPARACRPAMPGRDDDESRPRPGWYAISVSHLRGLGYWMGDGRGQWVRRSEPWYACLADRTPTARIGYSIYIYHLTSTECVTLRRGGGSPRAGAEGYFPESMTADAAAPVARRPCLAILRETHRSIVRLTEGGPVHPVPTVASAKSCRLDPSDRKRLHLPRLEGDRGCAIEGRQTRGRLGGGGSREFGARTRIRLGQHQHPDRPSCTARDRPGCRNADDVGRDPRGWRRTRSALRESVARSPGPLRPRSPRGSPS